MATNLDVAKNSDCEGTFDDLEALPDHGVVTDIKYSATARLDQQTNPIDKPVPQGLDGLKRPDCTSFAVRGASLRGAGLHSPHQVEGDDAEYLPGAVGVIALRRQAIEREAALERYTSNGLDYSGC